jgi:hypothetical protein
MTTGALGRSMAVAAGATLGLAWLFRHDYFVYSACVIGLAWWLRSRHDPAIWRLLPSAALGFAVVAGPWFAVLAMRRGLGSYVREIAGVTGTHAVGLGLPHPLIHWTSPHLTALFAAAYALPLLTAWHLVSTARSARPARDLAWIALGLSVAFLPQSMHRADAGHLAQVLPGCLMGIAALARRPVGASAAAILITALLWIGASLGIVTRPGLGWESAATSLRAAFVPAADILSVSNVTLPPVPVEALGFLGAACRRRRRLPCIRSLRSSRGSPVVSRAARSSCWSPDTTMTTRASGWRATACSVTRCRWCSGTKASRSMGVLNADPS